MKFLIFFWLLLMPLLASAAATPAGRIEETHGDARIYDTEKTMRVARVGDVVSEGDSIVTGADGEVHLAMEDEGQIAVRPNTRLRIARYKAEGGSTDTSIIALVQGALRSVTGWIGKYNPKGYAIRTPTATIGVRGTDHETLVIAESGSEGEAGTYDRVNHGATLLSTPHGQTEVRPNQAGFASLAGKTRPRVLQSVPGFFRPARLDNRFQNLHEKVRQNLEVKRTQRIEAIKERRIRRDDRKAAHQVESGRKHEGERRPLPQERREKMEQRLEQRRNDNRSHFEGAKQRAEEHRPGGAHNEARRERKHFDNDADAPGNNPHPNFRGGGHPGAGHRN